jgi:hypothetical protein
MRPAAPGFSRAEAVLYLCVSRCGLGKLSRVLVALTAILGVIGLAALALGV